MGFWNRSRASRAADDFSLKEMRRSMSAFGLVPSERARDMFGWTEEDDRRATEADLNGRKQRLIGVQAGDGSLRDEIELQIQIKAISRLIE